MPTPVSYRVPIHPDDGFDEHGNLIPEPNSQTPLLPMAGEGRHGFQPQQHKAGEGERTPGEPSDDEEDKGTFIPSDLFSPTRPAPLALRAFQKGESPLDPSIKQNLRMAIRQYASTDTLRSRSP